MVVITSLLAYWLYADYQATVYPDSRHLTSERVLKPIPNLYFRQESFYLTGDPFQTVNRWFANTIGMSPQPQGQQNCISMARRTTRLWFEQIIHVTLCETVNGRMIIDDRTIRLKID